VVGLLPQHRQTHPVVEHDVVALRVRAPESVDAFCSQPALGLDLVQQLLGVAEELARCGAMRWALEDRRELSLELQAWKKNVQSMNSRSSDSFGSITFMPVNGGFGSSSNPRAHLLSRASSRGSSVRLVLVCCARSLSCSVRLALFENRPAVFVEQVGDDADHTRRIEHVDGRAGVCRCMRTAVCCLEVVAPPMSWFRLSSTEPLTLRS